MIVRKISAHTEQRAGIIAGLPSRLAAFYLALFILGFLAYGALWRSAPLQTADSPGYIAAAQDLSDFDRGHLSLRTPGYPLLLLLTASSHTPTRSLFYASLMLHFISVWLLAVILSAAALSNRAIGLFGVLLLTPPFVSSAAYVMTENTSEFALVLGLTGLVFWISRRKKLWLVVSALAFSFSGLTHPMFQALGLGISICLISIPFLLRWARVKTKDAALGASVIVLASVLVIQGYAFSNYLKFNYFGLTPITGFALSLKTVKVIERLPEDQAPAREALIVIRDANLIKRNSAHTGDAYIWGAEPKLTEVTGLRGAQLSTYLTKLNLLLIRRAPLNYFMNVSETAVGFWSPDPAFTLENMNSMLLHLLWVVVFLCINTVFAIEVVVLGGATILFVTNRLVAEKRKTRMLKLEVIKLRTISYALAGASVAYTMAVTCLFTIGNPRYRIPVNALIVFMCFLGASMCWRIIRPIEQV